MKRVARLGDGRPSSPEGVDMNLSELRRGRHTSISRLKEFLACPRRFFLRNELKVKPDFRPAALALGVAWHAVVDEWLMRNATTEQLQDQLRDHLQAELIESDVPVLFDAEDENEGRFIDLAMKMLRTFVIRMKRPDKVIGVEVPFALELVHPETGEVLDVPVIGAIDALVVEAGKTAVWELKTGAKRWSVDQCETELQITMYLHATQEKGLVDPALRIIVTTKTALPTVQVADVSRVAGDIDELIETFFSVSRAIAAGVDHPARSWT
jgi:ATP-dependent helicase/DNAse subunit B